MLWILWWGRRERCPVHSPGHWQQDALWPHILLRQSGRIEAQFSPIVDRWTLIPPLLVAKFCSFVCICAERAWWLYGSMYISWKTKYFSPKVLHMFKLVQLAVNSKKVVHGVALLSGKTNSSGSNLTHLPIWGNCYCGECHTFWVWSTVSV